QPELYLLNTM
nr:Chain H, C-term (residues 493-54) of Wls (fitted sequence corresponds to hDMT1-II) [Mus musculus]7BLO_N Chain N, C-term (residues 493-54) of Wls (fitted sequence corresponds to hDMT1-II) [Mus musculus]7BLQ_U Chain U, The C-terminal portion of Kex2 cargo, fitted with Phi-X-(L/M) sorting motif of hDMT1-II cargo. [Thermochaetoides thermophila DSM 1495]7BLQ_V Chain V, The C-terminal portion of Kex2 cargo, fitted with Phi-X-(L/M) sorting motif of hDMT1-II cargo. [Thermochaetoides thermophila DSM 1